MPRNCYPSRTKQQRIRESVAKDPIFKPKIPIGTEVIYYKKYTDDWGYPSERRIRTQVLDESPKDANYQLKLKILVEGKNRWVSRSSVAPVA
jgi:hypothetical protein